MPSNDGLWVVAGIAIFCSLIFGIVWTTTNYYENLSEHKSCLNSCQGSYMNGEQKLDCVKSCNDKCVVNNQTNERRSEYD